MYTEITVYIYKNTFHDYLDNLLYLNRVGNQIIVW